MIEWRQPQHGGLVLLLVVVLEMLIKTEDDDEEDSIPVNFQRGLFEAWAGIFHPSGF
jgi:hypothetical protein